VDETSDQLRCGRIQVIVDEPEASLVCAEILPNASKNAVLKNDLNHRCIQGRDIEEGASEPSLKVWKCLTGQVRIYLDENLVTCPLAQGRLCVNEAAIASS
jgi:hypothetical protein